MASKSWHQLDDFFPFIHDQWISGMSVRSIHRAVDNDKVSCSYETFRTYVEHCKVVQKLPRRAPSRVGRPQKNRPTGLLFRSEVIADPASFPLLLEKFGQRHAITIKDAILSLGEVKITMIPEGQIDLAGFVVGWGQAIHRLGDTDFFMLASFLDPWRGHAGRWSNDWIAGVLGRAMTLKAELVEILTTKPN